MTSNQKSAELTQYSEIKSPLKWVLAFLGTPGPYSVRFKRDFLSHDRMWASGPKLVFERILDGISALNSWGLPVLTEKFFRL